MKYPLNKGEKIPVYVVWDIVKDRFWRRTPGCGSRIGKWVKNPSQATFYTNKGNARQCANNRNRSLKNVNVVTTKVFVEVFVEG